MTNTLAPLPADLTTLAPPAFDELVKAAWFAASDAEQLVDAQMGRIKRAIGAKLEWRGSRRVYLVADADALATAREKLNEPAAGSVKRNVGDVLADYYAAVEARDAVYAQESTLQAEYDRRPWPRYMSTTGSDAHIHSDMYCSTCNRGRYRTAFVFLTELSGTPIEQAIGRFQTTLCTVCFPDAPVAPAPARKTREQLAAERAAAAEAARVAEPKNISDVDGKPLRVGGNVLRTVRSAEIAAVSALDWAAYGRHIGQPNEQFAVDHEVQARQIVAALAAKNGTTPAEELARLTVKAVAKVKKTYGAEVAAAAAAVWAQQAQDAADQDTAQPVDRAHGEALAEHAVILVDEHVHAGGVVPVEVRDLIRRGDWAGALERMYALRISDDSPAPTGEPVHFRLDPTAIVRCGEPGAARLTVLEADRTCLACAPDAPVVDANRETVDTTGLAAGSVVSDAMRLYFAGRVRAAKCPHYIAASEARAGLTTCERCPAPDDNDDQDDDTTVTAAHGALVDGLGAVLDVDAGLAQIGIIPVDQALALLAGAGGAAEAWARAYRERTGASPLDVPAGPVMSDDELDGRLAAADADLAGAMQRQDDADAAAVAGAVERQDDDVLTAALQLAGEPVGPAASVDVPEQRTGREAPWGAGLTARVVESWRVSLRELLRSDGFVPAFSLGDPTPTLQHPAGVTVLVDDDGVRISYPDDNIADGDDGEGRGVIRLVWGTSYAAVRDVAAGLVMLVEAGKVVEPGDEDGEQCVGRGPADDTGDAIPRALLEPLQTNVVAFLQEKGRGGANWVEVDQVVGLEAVAAGVHVQRLLDDMYERGLVLASELGQGPHIRYYALGVPCDDCEGNGQNCLAHRTREQRRQCGW